MSEKNADFSAKEENAASEGSSQLHLVDIFLEELGRLKRIVAGMGLSASDCEDVLQDVSMQVMRRSGKYRSKEDSARWLIKVTVNRCLIEHRRSRTFGRGIYEILRRHSEKREFSTDEKVIVDEELQIMRKTLLQLDGILLVPMVLRYFCDLDSKEIGEILTLSSSTVRSRLREARLILAKQLIKRGVEP